MHRSLTLKSGLRALVLVMPLASQSTMAACTTDTTTADFAAGAPGGCSVAETADGEVILQPTEGAEFFDGPLPVGWGSFSWAPFGGGSPNTVVVAGGAVAIDGSAVRTNANYAPGRSLEFVATFGSERFQHVGFGDTADDDATGNQTYGGPPFAMFSTGSGGGEVLARVDAGSGEVSFPVGSFCSNATCQNQPHRYRVDWAPTGALTFYVDDVQVPIVAPNIVVNMRPAASDFNPAASVAALVVDWIRMTPYASSCTYDSAVLDTLTPGTDWTTATLSSLLPDSTGITVQTRSGDTPSPDGDWSSFQPLSGSTIQSPRNRYLQYRLELTSTSPELTPAAEAIEVCFDPCTPATEICDDADNDCDGLIDEDNAGGGGVCATGEAGVCAAGTFSCQSGTLVCVRNSEPTTEVCNGADDDCDASTDEGDPGGGGSCSTGQQGICAAGTNHCQAGGIVCVRNNPPTGETCNGLDDNCDGAVDEGDPGGGAACSTGEHGICSAGIQHCQSGSLACVRTNAPVVETCNGLDDNCDNATDEPFVDLNTPCSVGVGECARTGVKICRGDGTGTTCSVTPGSPGTETCDAHDNDCDGLIDEGNAGGGGACATGEAGVCAAGTFSCQSGTLVCVRNSQPTTEVCNGVDDDCDAGTDEGDPGGGSSCNTGLPGACGPGTRHCVGTHIVCQPNMTSTPETCNDADDNCNGQTDEGNPGGGGACNTGQLGACGAGTLQCQSGSVACVQNAGPTTELCLGGHDEDCDGETDELSDCQLCLAANTASTSAQTKKTKVRLTPTPDRDQVQTGGSFLQSIPASIRPDVEDVSLRITDGAGLYYQVAIPPGSFIRSSNGRRFSFSDPTYSHGGIRKAKFSFTGDGRTVKYSFKAQRLNEPPVSAGTGTATIQVGTRCFVDSADICTLSGSSATCR